jgi:hypothetical protein
LIERKNLEITNLKKENKNFLIRIHGLERETRRLITQHKKEMSSSQMDHEVTQSIIIDKKSGSEILKKE